MSTKAIREVLEKFFERASGDEPALWERANQEVEAIEKAARSLDNVWREAPEETWTLLDTIAKETTK